MLNTSANEGSSAEISEATSQNAIRKAKFLSEADKLALIANPFSPDSLALLGLGSNKLGSHESKVLMTSALKNLCSPPPLTASLANYECCKQIAELLIDNRKATMCLGPEELWGKLMTIGSKLQPRPELLAQSEWLHIFADIMARCSKVERFFNNVGAKKNDDGTLAAMKLEDCQPELQKIFGRRAALFDTGEVIATPLGIIITCNTETLARMKPDGSASGLNFRALQDPSWNGMINCVEEAGSIQNNFLKRDVERIVEHELRHGLQTLLDRNTEKNDKSAEVLSRLTKYIESPNPTIESRELVTAVRAYVYSVVHVASHEVSAYLDPLKPATLLNSKRMGITPLADSKKILEEGLWHASASVDQRREVFKLLSRELEIGQSQVLDAQVLVQILVDRGCDPCLIQAAFDISGINKAEEIARVFSVSQVEIQDTKTSMIPLAIESAKDLFVAKSLIDNFLLAQDRNHEILRPVLTELYEMLHNKPILAEYLKTSLSETPLKAAILAGDFSQLTKISLNNLFELLSALEIKITENMKWLSASQSFGSSELIVKLRYPQIYSNPSAFKEIIHDVTEGLSLYSSKIPEQYLMPLEKWASKILAATCSDLNSNAANISEDRATQLAGIVTSLESLIQELHKNEDLEDRFDSHAPEHMSVVLKMDTENISKVEVQDFIRKNSVFNTAWSSFEPILLDKFDARVEEDLSYILMASRQLGRVDVAFTALRMASSQLANQAQNYPPEIFNFVERRAAVLAETLSAYGASERIVDKCNSIAAAMKSLAS